MTPQAKVEAEPCRCVTCPDCRGSGQIEFRTNSYPEWDLDTCDGCGGSGIVERCERCQLLEEMDYEDV